MTYRLGQSNKAKAEVEGPLQFGLRDVLLLQLICALFVPLLIATGIFALLVVFVITLIVPWVHVSAQREPLRRTLFDLLAGVILPVLCVCYDPIVFVDAGPVRVLVYLAILFQVLALLAWLTFNAVANRPSGVFAGMLSVGTLLAGGIGLVMLPLSLIGLIALIGALGFTPFLTAYVFWRNTKRALKHHPAGRSERFPVASFVLGISLAVGIPIVVYGVSGDLLWQAIESVPFPNKLP